MPRRKWLVRGVVITIIAGCAGAMAFYQRFTNPAAVLSQVVAKLRTQFPGAHVSVESARLRIFGGISVSEIHFSRADDPERLDVAHIPSAILHHDKEKVLDGELALRKVELFRPRLKVVRRHDGTWNVAGLAGQVKLHVALPTLVIHHGTLIIEDKGAGASGQPLELSDINVTLINDPASAVAIDGSASSDFAGKVQVRGQWRRGSGDLAVQVKAEGITLSRMLLDALASRCSSYALDGLHLRGKADVQAELSYSPASLEPFSYEVRVDVTAGDIAHPKLPFPLQDVSASLHGSNGNLRLDKLTARSGQARLVARGSARLPAIDRFFEAHCEVQHLDVRPELFANLPEKLQALNQTYRPTGLATLKIDCARHDGTWVELPGGEPSRAVLLPEDVAACFSKFPYPLRHVKGTIDYNLLTQRCQFEVNGFAGARPVFIKGHQQGEAAQADTQIEIEAAEVALDKTLLDALPLSVRNLAAAFHATGKADIKGYIRHVPGHSDKDFRHEYHVRFHQATVQWEGFPYPLEDVSGFLDIFPKSYQFRDFKGTHDGGIVNVQGRSVAVDGKPQGLILEINGQNILLDDTLKAALTPMPALAKAWDTFKPRGRMHFAAVIDRSTAKNEDLDVRVEIRGGDVEPTFFPFEWQDISGQFRFFKNRLDLARISASHQKARFSIDRGTVDLHAKGGYYVDLKDVCAEGLILNEEFVQAIPHCLRGPVAALNVKEPIELKTWLVIAQDADPANPPDFFWDGQAKLKDATLSTGLDWTRVTGSVASVGRFHRRIQGINGNFLLEKGTLLNQPFQQITGKFQVRKETPDVLLLSLRAPLFGGDVSGQMRADFHAGLKYEMNLTASQIDLTEFGRHNLGPKSSLAGQLMGRLHLTGEGTGADTLEGNGSLDIPGGKILDLPLLIDLLKFLGLRWPDRTLFEEMHAVFGIHGRRLAVRRLDLVGNVISLSGKGEVNLDGTDVQLDFYPSWARIEQLLPPAVRPIPPVISKNLLTIEARGKVSANSGELKFHKKPIPVIVDPLLQLRDRMMGNSGPGPGIECPQFPDTTKRQK